MGILQLLLCKFPVLLHQWQLLLRKFSFLLHKWQNLLCKLPSFSFFCKFYYVSFLFYCINSNFGYFLDVARQRRKYPPGGQEKNNSRHRTFTKQWRVSAARNVFGGFLPQEMYGWRATSRKFPTIHILAQNMFHTY